MKYEHARIKWNNGNGALLCSSCSTIIAYGFDHEDKKHYCEVCTEAWIRRQEAHHHNPNE